MNKKIAGRASVVRVSNYCCILSFMLLAGCSARDDRKAKKDDLDKENIKPFEVDDPRVLRAYEIAQDSLPYYVEYYKRFYGELNYRFALKTKFEEGDEVEHMWGTPFKLQATTFTCILDNEPDNLQTIELGDTVEIEFDKIEDFIIVTADSIIIGNYLAKELNDGSEDEL